MYNSDYFPTSTDLVAAFLVCSLFFLWLIVLSKRKQLSSKEVNISLSLFALSIWVSAISEQQIIRIAYEMYGSSPRNYIWGIIPFAKLITPISLLAYMIYNGYLKNKSIVQERQTQVDDFVNRVFSNDKFYTAFSVSLPKGNDDKEFGLDYIPFMLQNIENKRRRFKIYADRFLTTTLLLGISFIIIVIFFGYTLLNDASTGIAKNITELKSEMNTANTNLALLQDYEIEQTLSTKYAVDFNQIIKDLSDKSVMDKPGIKYYLSAIQTFQKDNNFENLFLATKSSLDSLKNSKDNSIALNTISNLNSQLNKYHRSLEYANANYALATKELITIFPRIQQEIEKPQSQLNELIKRLILSVVIVSFFLVILRYTGRLYLNNYNLMIQAENDDLAIRKFYVALKNTDKNQEERKIVIERLLEVIDNDQDKGDKNLNLSKEESSMIKELLNNLMKKL